MQIGVGAVNNRQRLPCMQLDLLHARYTSLWIRNFAFIIQSMMTFLSISKLDNVSSFYEALCPSAIWISTNSLGYLMFV